MHKIGDTIDYNSHYGISDFLSAKLLKGSPNSFAMRASQRAGASGTDRISKGYHTTGTTDKGYVVYKDGNGHMVTIKPSGEVIPTTRMPVDMNNTSPKAPMYNQRTYYDGTVIPVELNDHTTGHNVGKISVSDFYPEPYKWDGKATWMGE